MILPDLIADWPDRWKELYEERAGIIEHDGKVKRIDAEFWAELDVRRQAESEVVPA